MKALYSIVGMKHRDAEQFVASLPVGEPLRLVREPTNDYDSNAVQVWARERHVGFVKATQAWTLAKAMDEQARVYVTAKLAVSGERWPMAEIDE